MKTNKLKKWYIYKRKSGKLRQFIIIIVVFYYSQALSLALKFRNEKIFAKQNQFFTFKFYYSLVLVIN